MRPYHAGKGARRTRRQYRARRVWFEPVEASVGAHLTGHAGEEGATAVYLAGAPPRAGWAAWHHAELPAGWSIEPSYFEGTTPILRYRGPAGERVEVHHSSEWFGSTSASSADVHAAWKVLELGVFEVFQGAQLLATPATTGRDLARRMFPRGHDFPPLDDATQSMLRETLGQARIEGPQTLIADEPFGLELPGLFEYDGRLMYAALCWSLPAGVPFHRERPSLEEIDDYSHGRYHVIARVPATWCEPFGILGVKEGRDLWRFPSTPNETFRTWCDGAELRLARRAGWGLEVLESLTFPRTVPALRRWSEAMISLRARVAQLALEGGYPVYVGTLAQAAVRQMVLTAIGAFQGRPHKVTNEAPVDDPPADMPTAIARLEGDFWQWPTYEAPKWAELCHPEWCATVWGRARARLLEAPTANRLQHAGALHLRHGTRVVAMRTDAMYLDRFQAWEDDGKAGRFRLRRFTHSSVPAPRTSSELLALRGDLERAQ